MIWRCRDRTFDCSARPLVMGVLNVTPDSFSDGGRYLEPSAAIARAHKLAEAGADLIDLGAESTRPGSQKVPVDEQLRRMMPVLEGLGGIAPALSIDTSNAAVATRALAAGAHVVNDVTALSDPDMPGVVRQTGAGLVLMHMRGTPATMQEDPRYDDVVVEVRDFLLDRMRQAMGHGVESDRIALDPGIGFGKAFPHSLELIARLPELVALGRPVLVGASRKSFLGRILDLPPDERLEGGLAVAAVSVYLGAAILRTHDVRETARATRVAAALRSTHLLHSPNPTPIHSS
jgi:dihydropteroate synthase